MHFPRKWSRFPSISRREIAGCISPSNTCWKRLKGETGILHASSLLVRKKELATSSRTALLHLPVPLFLFISMQKELAYFQSVMILSLVGRTAVPHVSRGASSDKSRRARKLLCGLVQIEIDGDRDHAVVTMLVTLHCRVNHVRYFNTLEPERAMARKEKWPVHTVRRRAPLRSLLFDQPKRSAWSASNLRISKGEVITILEKSIAMRALSRKLSYF